MIIPSYISLKEGGAPFKERILMCLDVYNSLALDEIIIAGTDVDPTTPPTDAPPLGPDTTPDVKDPEVPPHSFRARQSFSFSL